jgi:hypothetical protein
LVLQLLLALVPLLWGELIRPCTRLRSVRAGVRVGRVRVGLCQWPGVQNLRKRGPW